MRVADVLAGRFGFVLPRKSPTLKDFVQKTWRGKFAMSLKPSTRDDYEKVLRLYILPAFGNHPLPAITKREVHDFIADLARRPRRYSGGIPDPSGRTLATKTIRNIVTVLESIMVAAVRYEVPGLPDNPIKGILHTSNFPRDATPRTDGGVHFLELDDFRRAIAALNDHPEVQRMVIFAALTGLRWGELIALRIEDDVDFGQNVVRITRSLYRRAVQTPKTGHGKREVDLCPTARRILQMFIWTEGYIFSQDGKGQMPLGNGPWIKKMWRAAQIRVGIRNPISWHDLRHQYVSLLIAAGKDAKYTAEQAGHHSAGFTLDRYGHVFKRRKAVAQGPVEWWDELLWPNGCPHV